MGKLVQSSGVSQNAPLLGGHQSKKDVVFVVDATSSMRERWSETVTSIYTTMLNSFPSNTRYALVTYQDHPEGGGVAGNYPSRVDQEFTENPEDVLNALNKVELAPAGDPAESMYSGILAGLSLGWRKDASKVMLVLGDGPAKDPEPVTGLTWETLRIGSYAVSNTQVSTIGDPAAMGEGLAELAEATGGKAIPDSTAGKTPEDVANEVTKDSAGKPFSWLQGPYVAKVGSEVRLDARASHSPNGGVEKYEWDFDGDGTFDETTTFNTVIHRYDKEVSGHVMVRVTDAKGETSVGSAKRHHPGRGRHTRRLRQLSGCRKSQPAGHQRQLDRGRVRRSRPIPPSPLTLPDAESFGIAHPDRDALRRSVGVAKSHGLPDPDCLPIGGTDSDRRAEYITHDLGVPDLVAERQRLWRCDGATGPPATIGNSHGIAVDGTAFTDLGSAQ